MKPPVNIGSSPLVVNGEPLSPEAVEQRRRRYVPEISNDPRTARARRNRALLQRMLGSRLVDIVEVPAPGGDSVFIFYHSKVPPADNTPAIATAMLVEQNREHVRFEEVVHRGGAYFLRDGTNLAEEIRDGRYGF